MRLFYALKATSPPCLPAASPAPFFNSGYIGAADTALSSNLPLCAGRPVVKPIAHCDYHSLAGTQAGLDALADLYTGVPSVQVFQHIVIHGDDIHQRQASPHRPPPGCR